jgi:hypothetical protein
MSTYRPPSDLCTQRRTASNPSRSKSRRRGGRITGGTWGSYRGVEGDAALVLVDAVGGLWDADLAEVRAEEIHGRGLRRAAPAEGRV